MSKNKAIDEKFLVETTCVSPWGWRRSLPRLPGASTPNPPWKGSPASLAQPACSCSQTRGSLGLSGKRRKDESSRGWELMEHWSNPHFFSLKSASEKTNKKPPPNKQQKQTKPQIRTEKSLPLLPCHLCLEKLL